MQDNDNNSTETTVQVKKKRQNVRWLLVGYDIAVFLIVMLAMMFVDFSGFFISLEYTLWIYMLLFALCIFGMRFLFGIYKLMWRYGGVHAYIKLIFSDGVALVIYTIIRYVFKNFFFVGKPVVVYIVILAIFGINLVINLGVRLIYRHVFQKSSSRSLLGKLLRFVFRVFGNLRISEDDEREEAVNKNKINIAIVGAGSVGVSLAKELQGNTRSSFNPCIFIEVSADKIGRTIMDIPVYSHDQAKAWALQQYGVRELVFAVPKITVEEKKRLYDEYKTLGYKIRVYDFPTMQTAGSSKRQLRSFEIDELLFRKQIEITNEVTNAYYKDKVVLITGGGGSIGSELCRQIAKMQPKQLIILDVYENGAYNIQQELKLAYDEGLDLRLEILSVCDREGLEQVFAEYRPQIVINAAAHKHVPLMEHNCCEAVKNNVFGTLNTVEMSEKYGAERFMMVSTDKAVNPTNVMGATKRMCEMIVLSHGYYGNSKTKFSATRFGNVLGSAGSVIPLFKKQIANGGPITLTDFRIIRYFMTIPEASGLVLQSGAMAKNGELFVLDMGQPVKILDLAENMVRLFGLEPYNDIDIVETGLRPGEKLYEELLIKSEDLDKTENNLIFIERDAPLPLEEIENKLEVLKKALETNNNDEVREALRSVVPTFKRPEEVNRQVKA